MTVLDLIRWHERELTGLLARVDSATDQELHARMTARLAEATREREYVEQQSSMPIVNPFLANIIVPR